MYDGVLFQSPEFRSEKETDEKMYRFAFVVGKVTRDPEVRHLQMTRTTFNIKYHTKSYINMVIWGDSMQAQLAQCLKAGDIVLAVGTITKSYYTARKGAEKGMRKEWRDMNCQFICSVSQIYELQRMILSPPIQDLMATEEADALESAEDHLEDQEYGGYAEYESGMEYVDDEDIGL